MILSGLEYDPTLINRIQTGGYMERGTYMDNLRKEWDHRP